MLIKGICFNHLNIDDIIEVKKIRPRKGTLEILHSVRKYL